MPTCRTVQVAFLQISLWFCPRRDISDVFRHCILINSGISQGIMLLAVVQQHWQRHLSEAKRKHEIHVITGSVKCGVTSFTNEQPSKSCCQ